MINVSKEYINKLNDFSLSPKSKIVVDGVEYLGNVIKTFPKITHSATSVIGCFPTKTLSFEMYDLENKLNFEGKEITVYKGFVINKSVEYVKQGIFIPTAENIKTNITTKTISFENVRDRTQLLDDTYESKLDWSNGKKHSGLEIVSEICKIKNITLGNSNFAFANYMFKQPNFSEKITNRQVITRLAEIGGEIAFFDCEGKLVIKGPTEVAGTIQRKRYAKLSKEKMITYNSLSLGKDGKNDDIIYPEILENRVEFKILDNPFIDLYREEMIEEVSKYIIGFSYTPYTIKNFVDGYIYELNDVIDVIDRNGEHIKATILDMQPNLRIKNNLDFPENKSVTTDYTLAGSNKETLREVRHDVDHINQEILSLAKDVSEHSEEISSIKQSSEQIAQSVSQTITFKRKVEAHSKININDAAEWNIQSLSIKGAIELFYPSVYLFPSENLYPKDTYLIIDGEEKTKRVHLPINFLNTLNDTSDEFKVDDAGKCFIVRRIGKSEDGSKFILDKETIEDCGKIDIELFEGTNQIKMESFSDILLEAEYLVPNNITDNIVTEAKMDSAITQSSDNIMLEVNKKVDDTELGTKIIQNWDSVKIAWNQISEYLKFEGNNKKASLNIYDDDNNLLMKIDRDGQWLYDSSSKQLGKMGTVYTTYSDGQTKGLGTFIKEGNHIGWYRYNENTGKYSYLLKYYHDDPYNAISTGFVIRDDVYLSNDFNWKVIFGVNIDNIQLDTNHNFICVDRNNVAYSIGLSTSDGRLKKNIKNSEINALDILSQIKFREFDWKDNNKHQKLGYIAQELEEIESELVIKTPQKDENDNVLDNLYQIDSNNMIAYLTKSVVELNEIVNEQQKQISFLMNKLQYEYNTKAKKNRVKEIIPQYDEKIIPGKPKIKGKDDDEEYVEKKGKFISNNQGRGD